MKDSYSNAARTYDSVIEPLCAGLRGIGLKLVPPRPKMMVLDIGCGTGTHLGLYEKAGCEVHGIEPSPAMRAVAQGKTRATICDVDVSSSPLPYDDDTFDLIITSMVLHETAPATRAAILTEARRVLKPEGQYLIIDYYRGKLTFPRGWFHKAAITFIEFVAGRDHFRNFRQFMAQGGIEALVAEHPYVVTERKVVSGGNLGVLVLRHSSHSH